MSFFDFKYYGNDIVAYDNTLFTKFSVDLFNPNYLNENSLLSQEQFNDHGKLGRGRVYKFDLEEQTLVLRHYYRGGAMANISSDKYIWAGLGKTRAIRELQLLAEMRKMGLPVPVPVAAHIHRIGATYTADIVTKFIPATQSLSSLLYTQSISNKTWSKIGVVIRQLHKKKCNHVDLNAHNILLDKELNIFLIDFDKSEIKTSSGKWQMRNIERLKRSLEKLASSNKDFNYTSEDFVLLMRGYAA